MKLHYPNGEWDSMWRVGLSENQRHDSFIFFVVVVAVAGVRILKNYEKIDRFRLNGFLCAFAWVCFFLLFEPVMVLLSVNRAPCKWHNVTTRFFLLLLLLCFVMVFL